MAVSRPWVKPEEVKQYSSYAEVLERPDEKLAFDIARAEAKVIKITHNRFDGEEYENIPDPVKMAVILLAEAYAKNTVENTKKKIKSETYDDYSYTLGESTVNIDDLGISDLLEGYIIEAGAGKVTMKLRKL